MDSEAGNRGLDGIKDGIAIWIICFGDHTDLLIGQEDDVFQGGKDREAVLIEDAEPEDLYVGSAIRVPCLNDDVMGSHIILIRDEFYQAVFESYLKEAGVIKK